VRATRFALPLSLGLLLWSAAGCLPSRQHTTTYVDQEIINNLPRRIVVVPFNAPNCTLPEKEGITRAMAAELQGLLVSEIVLAPAGDDHLAYDANLPVTGEMDVDVLVRARKRYHADAFVFGSVTHYRAYDPPVLGLKIRMISSVTGKVLWGAEALMNAADGDVRHKAIRWMHKSGLGKWDSRELLIFNGTRHYPRFVMSEIVNSFKAQALPPPEPKPLARKHR